MILSGFSVQITVIRVARVVLGVGVSLSLDPATQRPKRDERETVKTLCRVTSNTFRFFCLIIDNCFSTGQFERSKKQI